MNFSLNNGMTALMTAAAKGAGQATKLLADTPGVKLNTRDLDGFTALMHAVVNGHLVPTVILTMNPGTDVNLPNLAGSTPLMQVRTW